MFIFSRALSLPPVSEAWLRLRHPLTTVASPIALVPPVPLVLHFHTTLTSHHKHCSGNHILPTFFTGLDHTALVVYEVCDSEESV
ncbi:hypothetical protein C8R48DRAFT_696815 [Suillus tomentosus]|nr:hypothetical protein C8R48DRAFT_696815 [Suillus tomentosus]